MTPKLRFAAATLAVLCLSTVAFADVRLPDNRNNAGNRRDPKPPVGRPYSMSIEADYDNREAELLIPASALRQLRAELEDETPSFAASLGVGGLPPAHTAAAGVLLSLGLVFGGLWFARSGRSARVRRTAVVIAVCALCAGAATTLTLANLAPPSMPLNAGTLPQAVDGDPRTGRVRVFVVRDDVSSEIKLIVPKPR
ncbi:MAG TPA: hypothetical protein VGX48_10070 [Pyrinomonadaceae bacterium]|jgi:hypothetical protein|nr:hypothetical protein [Pyrinomonadaceae bacterium]